MGPMAQIVKFLSCTDEKTVMKRPYKPALFEG